MAIDPGTRQRFSQAGLPAHYQLEPNDWMVYLQRMQDELDAKMKVQQKYKSKDYSAQSFANLGGQPISGSGARQGARLAAEEATGAEVERTRQMEPYADTAATRATREAIARAEAEKKLGIQYAPEEAVASVKAYEAASKLPGYAGMRSEKYLASMLPSMINTLGYMSARGQEMSPELLSSIQALIPDVDITKIYKAGGIEGLKYLLQEFQKVE